MFKESDFNLPLEMEFKRSIINSEIDQCNNIDELRSQLKDAVRLAMSYQNLLGKTLTELITSDIEKWIEEASKIEKE
ncbi:MAG: hypothetical protein CL681_06145 [Blastopirellula sp.]|nr:hypothetical protein [Blastopirellula sp.]|tara:strand:+ start:771 stop:1001 length:231 start_codon:yes stop_codon:yes gene_type:complete